MIALVAFFAVAFAALKFANDVWWMIVMGAALVLFMAMAVMAVASLGAQRAFACGVVVCMAIYGSVIYLSGHKELVPQGERGLPTTWLLSTIFTVAHAEKQPGVSTTEFSGAYADRPMVGYGYGDYGGYGDGGYAMPFGESRSWLPGEAFMAIGHVLWTIVLGLAGGVFAVFVYARRGTDVNASN
ncbi:MAG: hypothetical protein R3C10_19215 [Pirellulales bacterium]